MTVTETPAFVSPTPVRRFTWPAAVALHLLPAGAAVGAAAVLGVALRVLDVPAQQVMTVASVLVLLPVEIVLLLRAAHRVTGTWSPWSLPAVLSYRRRLPFRLYAMLLPSLTALAFGGTLLFAPVREAIERVLPDDWLLPAGGAVSSALVVALVVDALIRPVVEELYLHAYLLPRLPVRGGAAVVVSAALFAAQHAWQPGTVAFVFVAELVLTAVVVRLDSVRIGIAARCLTGGLSLALALIAVLH